MQEFVDQVPAHSSAPTLVPTSAHSPKAALPSAKSTTAMNAGQMFPSTGPQGAVPPSSYKPESDTISQKQPTPPSHKLRTNASQAEYRAWKFQAIAFCKMCEPIKYSEASAQAALFSTLSESLARYLILFFAEKLGQTTVADVRIHTVGHQISTFRVQSLR